MVAKDRTLVVKVPDEMLNMLHKMADDCDDSIARIVRRLITTAYTERYGLAKPPKAKLKHQPAK